MNPKRYVPVLGRECGLGLETLFGVYKWEDEYFVPHVIEIDHITYTFSMRRPLTIGRTKGVWVHENFFVPPDALYQTEHEAWQQVFAWIDMMEKSILNAAQ